MKTFRKYLAMISLIGVCFAFLFYVLHLEGALELMLINGALFLVFAATDNARITMIIGLLTALTLVGGVTLKIMHLEGANTLVMIALGLLFPVYAIVYFVRLKHV